MSQKDTQTKKKVAKKLSERYLRNAGEYYLNRFPASSDHFVKVMTRKIDRSCKDHPDQDRQKWIDHLEKEVVPYFQKIGFLNDTLYANALFESLRKRGLSKMMIISKMTQKSVPSHMIDDVLNQDFDDKEAVIDFAKKKKIGRYNPHGCATPKDRHRDLGKLARAGFSYDIAMSVFD
jgi:regulatory protein